MSDWKRHRRPSYDSDPNRILTRVSREESASKGARLPDPGRNPKPLVDRHGTTRAALMSSRWGATGPLSRESAASGAPRPGPEPKAFGWIES